MYPSAHRLRLGSLLPLEKYGKSTVVLPVRKLPCYPCNYSRDHLHGLDAPRRLDPSPLRALISPSGYGWMGGAAASNSSPPFGFSVVNPPIPFVGLGSGRTSGIMERTRKESLLGSSRASRFTSYRDLLVMFLPRIGYLPCPYTVVSRRFTLSSRRQFHCHLRPLTVIQLPFKMPRRQALVHYLSSFGNRPGSLATGSGFSSGSGGTSHLSTILQDDKPLCSLPFVMVWYIHALIEGVSPSLGLDPSRAKHKRRSRENRSVGMRVYC